MLTIRNPKGNIEEYLKIGAKAFIFGLRGFSTNEENSKTIDEIKKIREEYNDIDIFITMNNCIFNSELEKLEQVLEEIDKLNIQGILFYDLAILNIHQRKKLKTDLVWNQTHMVTNYNTCNYYYEAGVSYGYLSSEITLDEMVEIKEKSKMKFFVSVFGYPVMSHSKRKLLSNFFSYNQKKLEEKEYLIKERGEVYKIKEDETGDTIYYGKLLNGSSALQTLKNKEFPYLVATEDGIDHDLFMKVCALYQQVLEKEDSKILEEIEEKIGNNTGFFYKKTIYKVKKNEG